MLVIKILGTGCAGCRMMEERVVRALRRSGSAMPPWSG